jgi:hypothetical protein
MRAIVQRSLACAIVSVAAGPWCRVLAQPGEEAEEIVVRAKPLNRYRAEIELARDEMIRLFNEANEGDDNDVARVKDDAGTSTPIEFSEMWENPDGEDYVFYADYPIGDDVYLESVRVRNLTCACEGPAP